MAKDRKTNELDVGESWYRLDYNYGSSKHMYSYIISNPLDVILDSASKLIKQARENKEYHRPFFVNVAVKTYDRDAHTVGSEVAVFFNADFCKQLR